MNKPFRMQLIVIFLIYVVLIALGYFVILPDFGESYFWFYIILIFAVLGSYSAQLLISKSKRLRINDLENKIREISKTNKFKINSEDIALNYLPVGIVIYDEEEEIVFANAQAKEFFSNVLVGRSLKVISKDLSENVSKRIGKFRC
mgnify:CR=1 FL=1